LTKGRKHENEQKERNGTMKERKDFMEIAEQNLQRAIKIIKELQIIETWKKFGITANLIGSVPTGLLMKNKDIDFHVYSDNFSIAGSFYAIAEFAKNQRVKRITYDNLLDTDEKCLEWHMWYMDNDNELWQIDMIHILIDSFYAGKMERVVERINEVLTPELKKVILSIKNDIPEKEKIMGIEIYMAVIRDHVRNYPEFTEWRKTQNNKQIIDWIP
jgi:predicted nucleotidyltransferase